jgi:hypothetical protein
MEHPARPARDPRDGFVLLGAAPEPPPGSGIEPSAPEHEDSLEPGIPRSVLELDRLFTELEPVAPEQVVLTLTGSAAARLAGRAAFLGMLGADVAARVAVERDWQLLLSAGLSAAQLALLVRAEPWLPPVQHGALFCRWLVRRGLIQEEQLEALRERSVELGWPMFQVAIEQGLLDERGYIDELSRFTGLRIAKPRGAVSREVLVSFPVGWVEHFDMVPIERVDGRFVVAVARPLPTALLDRLAVDAGAEIELQLAPPAAVAAWQRRYLRHWWRVHRPGLGDVD